jgi:ferrous iron transport protein A
MNNKFLLTLADLPRGQTGRVVRIDGGLGMKRHLEALGIHPGVTVTKVSDIFGRGPAVINVAGGQLAVGYGKTRRIWVEVE